MIESSQNPPEPILKKLAKYRQNHLLTFWDELTDSQRAELLADMRRRVRIGLCSNFSHSQTALRILEESDLRRHFDAIAISESVGIRKPRTEIFAAALDRLGVGPAEVLHVGDSLTADVGGAAASGIPSVWITRRVSDPDRRLREHTGPKPDFVIRDLSEMSSLLDRFDS